MDGTKHEENERKRIGAREQARSELTEKTSVQFWHIQKIPSEPFVGLQHWTGLVWGWKGACVFITISVTVQDKAPERSRGAGMKTTNQTFRKFRGKQK